MKIKKIRKIKKGNFKNFRKVEYGIVHILSTFNNTIINITDNYGNTISWGTAAMIGAKSGKKVSSYSTQLCSETVGKKAMILGLKNINIIIKGPGPGRDLALKGLINVGFKIISIRDATPIPHNGCKPRKVRRI